MSRPYIICHMACSLDGRIIPSRWTPRDAHSSTLYDGLHDRLGGGSWMVGRVTGAEFAKACAYPTNTGVSYPREAWLPQPQAAAFAVIIDASGKIAWGRSEIGGDPIVVVLSKSVSDDHLAGLRRDGVGYLFAGDSRVDMAAALEAIRSALAVETLLLEGGGHLNGALFQAGLVDEISLVLVPAIDGREGAPALFDGESNPVATLPQKISLISHEEIAAATLWLRYRVEAVADDE